jgi:MFS family permease
MALRVACPSCRSEVVVDQVMAGCEVACPRCGGRFTAPSNTTAPSPSISPATFAPLDEPTHHEPELESLPRFDRRRDLDIGTLRVDVGRRWKTTVVGLGMMFWATIAMVGTMFPLLITAGIADHLGRRAGQPPGPEHAAVIALFFGLICVMLLLAALYYVGMCLCCGVPPESGARGRAIAAVLLSGLFVVAGFFTIMALIVAAAQQQGREPITPGVAVVVALAFTFLAWAIFIFWMLFHRAVALYFGNRSLARAALFYLLAYVAVMLSGVLMIAITADPPGNPAAGLAVLFNLLSNTALFIWFLVILRRTRRTIVEGVQTLDRPVGLDDDA